MNDDPSPHVAAGLSRLAGIPLLGPTSFDALVTEILKLVVESLDVGLALLSTVEDQTYHVQTVYDRVNMKVRVGDVLRLCDTY